jgi:hypothetical protein
MLSFFFLYPTNACKLACSALFSCTWPTHASQHDRSQYGLSPLHHTNLLYKRPRNVFTTPHLLRLPYPFNFETVSSWRTDPTQLPEWRERPKCHYGFRTIMSVLYEDGHYGCRYFTCPDLDDDFMVRTTTKSLNSRYLLST